MQKPGQDSNQHRRSRHGFSINTKYLLVAPGLANTTIFLLLPTFLILVFSLYTYDAGSMGPPYGIQNYVYFFQTPAYVNSLILTLKMSAIVTIVCLGVGYPIAYLLAMYIKDESTQLITLLAMLVPWWIDFTIRGMAWLPVLGQAGLVNIVLMGLGLTKEPITYLIFNEFSALAVMIQGSILFMVSPIFMSLGKIDKNIIEAAETLGANRFKAFYHVTFRMSAPGIVIGSIFVFVASMADFVSPRTIGGGLMPIGLNVVNQVGILNWPLASAMSMILVVITIAVVVVMVKIVDIKQMLF